MNLVYNFHLSILERSYVASLWRRPPQCLKIASLIQLIVSVLLSSVTSLRAPLYVSRPVLSLLDFPARYHRKSLPKQSPSSINSSMRPSLFRRRWFVKTSPPAYSRTCSSFACRHTTNGCLRRSPTVLSNSTQKYLFQRGFL